MRKVYKKLIKKELHLITPLFVSLLIFIMVSCGNSESSKEIKIDEIRNPASAEGLNEKEKSEMPVLSFERLSYDFGKVIQGEKLSYSFKFTNTGKSNLIISSVDASCNCTVSTPPKAPILPGKSDEIKVSFDSRSKQGPTTTHVIVYANTYPNKTVLTINANVVNP